MFFSINNKKSLFLQKLSNTYPRSRFLATKKLDLLDNAKAIRAYRMLLNATKVKIESLNRFNLDEVESNVNSYLRLMSHVEEGMAKLEDVVKGFDKLQDRVRIETDVHKTKIDRKDIQSIQNSVRDKCRISVNEIREQLHLTLDKYYNVESMQYQRADSIYEEFKNDLKIALDSVEKKANREFKEKQLSKSLELAHLKNEEEQRKDIDRDYQITEAKRKFNDQIEAYDLMVKNELAAYKLELEVRHKDIDKKVESIDNLLVQKQKEMYDDLIQKSDGIINHLAEQKAAEILKKLGVKL